MKIKLEKAPEHVLPKCPFCEYRMEKIWVKTKVDLVRGQARVMLCPQCEAVLGYHAGAA